MTSATLHELEAAGDVTVVPDAEIVLARIAALRGDTWAALEWVKRLSSADVLSESVDRRGHHGPHPGRRRRR